MSLGRMLVGKVKTSLTSIIGKETSDKCTIDILMKSLMNDTKFVKLCKEVRKEYTAHAYPFESFGKDNYHDTFLLKGGPNGNALSTCIQDIYAVCNDKKLMLILKD
jgi:hypothetical protein